MNSAQTPPTPDIAHEFRRAVNAYTQNSDAIYNTEAKDQPRYAKLAADNTIGAIAELQPGATDQAIASYVTRSTDLVQNTMARIGDKNVTNMENLARYSEGQGKGFLESGVNEDLYHSADRAVSDMLGNRDVADAEIKAGRNIGAAQMLAGRDATYSDMLAGRDRTDTSLASTEDAARAALSGEDPLAAALRQRAGDNLALGGNISDEEARQVEQASRAADSARGVFNSSGSRSRELLNRENYQRQRENERISTATGVQQQLEAQRQAKLSQLAGVTQARGTLWGSATSTAGEGYQSATKSAADLWEQATSGAASLYGNTTATAGQLKRGAIESALDRQLSRQTLGESLLKTGGTLYGNASAQRMNYLNAVESGTDPLAWISGATGVTRGAGPNIYNSLGLTQWQQDLTDTTYNAQAATGFANAKARNDMVGAGIGAAGSIIGAVGMAFL